MSVTVFAANFSDVNGHWAEGYIQRWSEERIINGYEDATFRPNNNITRAEYVAMMMRIFEPMQTADLSQFSDVNRSAWYYDALSRAYAMGVINGYSSNSMMPEANITRQEAIVILNRMINLPLTSNASQFTDASEIAEWAKNAVVAFAENQYVNGYEDGSIKPNAYITRAEITKILDIAIAKMITQPGEYDMNGVTENVVVKAEGVTLKNTANLKKIFVMNDAIKSNLTVDSAKEIIVISSYSNKEENNGFNEEATQNGSGGNGAGSANEEKKSFDVTLTTKGNAYDVQKQGTFEDGTELTITVDGKEIIANELFAKERFSQFKLNLMGALDTNIANKTISGKKLKNTLKNSGVDVSDTDAISDILGEFLSGDDKAFIEDLINSGTNMDSSEKEDAMIELGMMFLNMDYDSFKTMMNQLGS